MKKFIFLLVAATMATTVSFAQNAKELAKEHYKADKMLLKLMNVKPTSSAKKEARKYEKEGWLVPAGEVDIATQITKSQIYAEELLRDDAGFTTRRYVQSTAIAKARSYNAAYNTAVQNAKADIAASLQTEIIAAMQSEIDNEAVSATGVEKFNMYFVDLNLQARVKQNLKERFPYLKATNSLVNNVELNHMDADKGVGLRALCEYLNVPIEKAMAFGDGDNDSAMLLAAGCGVAMGNAEDCVKECADMIAPTNEEDGLARIIEEYIL